MPKFVFYPSQCLYGFSKVSSGLRSASRCYDKVPDRLLTDGQCRMMINGIQFIHALLETNGLAVGKDHQFKGRYDAEKNAVVISLEENDLRTNVNRK